MKTSNTLKIIVRIYCTIVMIQPLRGDSAQIKVQGKMYAKVNNMDFI